MRKNILPPASMSKDSYQRKKIFFQNIVFKASKYFSSDDISVTVIYVAGFFENYTLDRVSFTYRIVIKSGNVKMFANKDHKSAFFEQIRYREKIKGGSQNIQCHF